MMYRADQQAKISKTAVPLPQEQTEAQFIDIQLHSELDMCMDRWRAKTWNYHKHANFFDLSPRNNGFLVFQAG
jgi:hypothetical protein